MEGIVIPCGSYLKVPAVTVGIGACQISDNIGSGFSSLDSKLAEAGRSQTYRCQSEQCNDFFQFFHKKILLIVSGLFLYGEIVVTGFHFFGDDYEPPLFYMVDAGRQGQEMISELCRNAGVVLG